MPVQYNDSKLIPAPQINIVKEYQRSDDGQKIGKTYTLNVQGTIVAFKGSPDSNGDFWTLSDYPPDEEIPADERLKAILKKQKAILELFSVDGLSFEIQPLDGSAPTKCNPRVLNINFAEGIWYDRCDYTITLQAETLIGPLAPDDEDNFDEFISQANEEWNIEFNDQAESIEQRQTFRVTHNISATGKLFYDVDGSNPKVSWEQARDWVQARLGLDFDRVRSSGALNIPNYFTGFNHSRTESVNEFGGQYNVSETWILSSGNALEDFNVSIQTSAEDGLTRVSIDGNVIGLETRSSSLAITQDKWAAASGKFSAIEGSLFSRATAYANNHVLNVNPVSKVIRKNPFAGTVGYTVEYDDRPGTVIAGAISDTITVVDHNPGDVFAIIPILGRAAGPILQDISTIRETRRELSIEAVMPYQSGSTLAILVNGKPDTSAIVATVRPTASQVFKESDVENWTARTGRYTRNVSWVYQ